MGCCKGGGDCRCVVQAATPAACNPFTATVVGSGSSATPFSVGGSIDLNKLVSLHGYEPWSVGADTDGCTKLLLREGYQFTATELMVDGAGAFVGYAFLELNRATGAVTQKYLPLGGVLTSTLPTGWIPSCDEHSSGEIHPMCTDSGDPLIEDPIAGWFFLRYNKVTAVYDEQYVSLAGSTTSSKPALWQPCGGCFTDTGGGGGGGPISLTLTNKYITTAVSMANATTANTTWTDMPAAAAYFLASERMTTRADLTDWTEARLVVRKMGTAGAAASKLIAKYSTVNPAASFVGGDWLDLGASEISVAINVQNQVLVSSWIALPSGAKADVYLSIIGSGGDGALDPIFGNTFIQFRRQVTTDVTATGSGGGGGGGGGGANAVELAVMSGLVLPGAKYPDGGISGMADADKYETFVLPPGFTTSTWGRMDVVLTNVHANLTANFKLTLKNLTAGVDVGSITIASGSSPTGTRLRGSLALSGTVADGDNLQWFIETVETTGVDFLLRAYAFYVLA